MFRTLIRFIVIVQEAFKALIQLPGQILRWAFGSKGPMTFFIILVLLVAGWCAGFLHYVSALDKSWPEIVRENPQINERTDAIVVLTGGSERLRHGFFLLEQGMAGRLFISGVNKEVKLHELFVLNGYPPSAEQRLKSRVELGYAAADTIENAKEIANWVRKNNVRSIRLVTSNYHIRRAKTEIQSQIPDVRIIEHGVLPINIRTDKWWKFKSTRSLLLAEYNKYLLAEMRIFVEKLGL